MFQKIKKTFINSNWNIQFFMCLFAITTIFIAICFLQAIIVTVISSTSLFLFLNTAFLLCIIIYKYKFLKKNEMKYLFHTNDFDKNTLLMLLNHKIFTFFNKKELIEKINKLNILNEIDNENNIYLLFLNDSSKVLFTNDSSIKSFDNLKNIEDYDIFTYFF